MKEELTREELKRFILFAKDKDTRKLATALLEEMDKPKVDVWKDAPEWATSAEVTWESATEGKRRTGPTYTRELQKTRIDKIVEEVIDGRLFGLRMEKSELAEMLKSALEKYAAELGTAT